MPGTLRSCVVLLAPAMGRCGLASSSLSEPDGGVDGLGVGGGVGGLGGDGMAVVGVFGEAVSLCLKCGAVA